MAEKQTAKKGGKQNIRIPFFGAYSNRSNDPNKDQRFINVIPESRKVQQLDNTRMTITKRPGLKLFANVGATGEGRGFIFFKNNFLAAVGNKVYRVTSAGVSTSLITLSNSTGDVGMIWCDSVTLGEYIFICDGTKAWVVNDLFTVTEIVNDGVTSISLTNGGTHYVTAPNVVISGGGGTGATALATVSGGSVTKLEIVNKGTGYTSDPTVTINSIGSGATATCTVASGYVTTITVTNGGSGFTVPPDVVFTGGGGSGAIGTAVLTGDVVTSIIINSQGDGYSTPPNIHITSGEGATGLTFKNGFPTPHIPSPTFIDGYVLLPGAGTELSGLIYNSTNDDPTDWPANEYIAAEMFPDTVTTLARQNNQVIAFGPISTEFFYDAANVNESPLSRNDAAAIQIGIAAPSLVYQNERFCAFVGQSESGGRAVWVVEGFQPKKISDEFIEKILDAEGDMSHTHGYGLRTMGHMLFLINLKNQNRTLVYDFDEKIWHEWSSSIGSQVYNEFRCDHTADDRTGAVHMLDIANGNIYKLLPTYYQDDYDFVLPYNPLFPIPDPQTISTPIRVKIRTNKFDMDTYNRKFMSSMEIVGDRYTTNNNVNVTWTDDDYETYNNGFAIPLTSEWPSHPRLGAFRRRAFSIDHTQNMPLRLEALEITYEEGVA